MNKIIYNFKKIGIFVLIAAFSVSLCSCAETKDENDDILSFSEEEIINNITGGDVIGAFSKLQFKGGCSDMRYIAVSSVISGKVNGNVTAFSLFFREEENGSIENDLYIIGKNAEIDGVIAGDVYFKGEEIKVKGKIGGDLKSDGKIILEKGALVSGNLSYKSADTPIIPQDAVLGKIENTYEKKINFIPAYSFVFFSAVCIALFFLIRKLPFPDKKVNPLKIAGSGLLIAFSASAVLFAALVILPFLLGIIGAGKSVLIVIVIAGAVIIYFAFAEPIFCIYLGRRIYKSSNKIKEFFIGFAVVRGIYLCIAVMQMLSFEYTGIANAAIFCIISVYSLGIIYYSQKKKKKVKKTLAKDNKV